MVTIFKTLRPLARMSHHLARRHRDGRRRDARRAAKSVSGYTAHAALAAGAPPCRPRHGETCGLVLLAVLLFTGSGCGEWPDLASVPDAAPIAPQPPVRLPPAMRSTAPFDAEAAGQALRLLPSRLERLEVRISGQQALYLQARRDAETQAGEESEPQETPITRRTAEFELSRLSALETDLSTLLEDLERLRLSPLSEAARGEVTRLRKRAEALDSELSAFLARERRRLARLSDRE